jgi:ribosomal protein L12E/L44/L45/RPP1/RPP2
MLTQISEASRRWLECIKQGAQARPCLVAVLALCRQSTPQDSHHLHNYVWFVQGLVDAWVANSQQAKAVSYLTGLRDKILANAAPAAAAAAGSSEAAAAADAASSSAGAAAEQASSSEQQLEVDPIGVQLLLGELMMCCSNVAANTNITCSAI